MVQTNRVIRLHAFPKMGSKSKCDVLGEIPGARSTDPFCNILIPTAVDFRCSLYISNGGTSNNIILNI
jgi:hypothetical protein